MNTGQIPDEAPEWEALRMIWECRLVHSSGRLRPDGRFVRDPAEHGTVRQGNLWIQAIEGKGMIDLTVPQSGHRLALHRKFANLKKPEHYLRFANAYGLLGPISVRLESAVTGGGFASLPAESCEAWADEVLIVKLLLALWSAATSDTTTTRDLRTLFSNPMPSAKWTGGQRIDERGVVHADLGLDPFNRLPGIARSLIHPAWNPPESYVDSSRVYRVLDSSFDTRFDYPPTDLGTARLAELRRLATWWVQEILNAQLVSTARPMVRVDRRMITAIPRNLLGAIYWSFAEEIVGHRGAAIKCLWCGNFTPRSYINKRFCGDTCSKAYRRHQKRTNES